MSATPAWPPGSTPRLFIDSPLSQGLDVRIDTGQAHYLLSVMRIKTGAPIRLFDDRTGEWLAEVSIIGKRDLILTIVGKLRERDAVPDLWLLAAPIKKARIDWVAEKACELGIARYQPVITRRTVIERLNLDRLRAHMIEAAEQCGRTALPFVAEPEKLAVILKSFDAGRRLFFADEAGGMPMLEAVKTYPGPAALLVGPEGGFDQQERDALNVMPSAIGVSLGPRILRAETAALTAISIWMSVNGDWAEPI